MITYKSQVNGGTTVVLPSLAEAVKLGKAFLDRTVAHYEAMDPKTKIKVSNRYRDGKNGKVSVNNASTMLEKWKDARDSYNEAAAAIYKGDATMLKAIAEQTEVLTDRMIDIEPMLAASRSGFVRAEDGIDASPELLASGDERPCFRRGERGDMAKDGEGDGAYRIVINTDVAWWGKPEDNASLIGALIMCLKAHRPVEVWIQQGWLGRPMGDDDGVTLFKLDFTGGFDPTALAFWCGHPGKDIPFSSYINRELGRIGSWTSEIAEIPCDLFIRGDWMLLAGLDQHAVNSLPPFELQERLVKWMAATACRIVYKDNGETLAA